MTPDTSELAQWKRQNAMLLRQLLRVQAERDALRQQLAAIQPPPEAAATRPLLKGGA